MIRVLLSASHPHGGRAGAARPYSHPDIDLAASAVIEAVLERSDVVLRFGGHPSITPLVLDLADSFRGQQGAQIELVHSAYFAKEYTEEMRQLAAAEGVSPMETPAVDDPGGEPSRSLSLSAMRATLSEPDIHGVFFIGGMDGLDEELVAVQERHPQALIYFFIAPGGRAATLGAEVPGGSDSRARAVSGRAYLLRSRQALVEILSAIEGLQ